MSCDIQNAHKSFKQFNVSNNNNNNNNSNNNNNNNSRLLHTLATEVELQVGSATENVQLQNC